ncbi:ABC transporter permease [Mycetocola sp. JXN-3]|uniref:ABC transporter permease n=1 Tax=Mycetocola sp. JXN-3 TaxID=2116510 RepID=UPI00165D1326|nr:ABC transporter permease [Mycetocola sp. JXN-3]
MSIDIERVDSPNLAIAPSARTRLSTHRVRQVLSWVLFGLGLLILARYLADAPGITASSTWGSALRLTVPIAVVAMGGLFSERSGVINVGLEGMMIGGTWMAGLFGALAGPWAALLGGIIGGLIFGVLMAVLCIEMGINQLIVGISINVIAAAVARFASDIVFTQMDGGSVARSPRIGADVPHVSVPFLSGGLGTPDLAQSMESSGVPVLSQIGGVLGGLTRDVSVAALIGLALIPITAWILWKTPFGLRWRSAGEEPLALQALGGSVHGTRWASVLAGSALAGFAGGYLTLISQGYIENQTAGTGFIGLATLIFGNWMPSGVFYGSALFGFSDAVGLGRPETLRALVFLLAIVFTLLGVRRLTRVGDARRVRAGLPSLILGVILLIVFVLVPLPTELSSAAPYLVTLAVLVVAGSRMRPPAALGKLVARRTRRG